LAVFWIHFGLLQHSGQGDAFMSTRFQSTLIGNANYDPTVRMSFWDKFIDLNYAMNTSEEGLKTATHPYGSKWTSWPLMIRSVYYWQGDTQSNGTQGNIYLLGNPAIWWGILIVIGAGLIVSPKALERLRPYRFPLALLAIGYLMNFLPFSQIVRVMFLYHYLFAFIYSLAFALIMLGALADWMRDDHHFWKFSSPTSRNLYIGVFTLTLISFIYFAPLTYGVPLTPAELAGHIWLPSWR
jgi:dolichyl-phosphate-mannose--protein O-mannosyl transferase